LVLAAVWTPLWLHYRIPQQPLSASLVERARVEPADSVLDELAGARFPGRRWSDEPNLVPMADRLLRGEAVIPGYPPAKVRLPFDAAEVERGLPNWQLQLASLMVPEILLSAYEATGREEFLLTARDAILGWANYERRTFRPDSYVWNDHAVVCRVAVLAHFWRLYRHHPSYDPVAARTILEFALRGGYLLAAPAHFTYATNHGIMQNLGLWHLTLAFPWIADRDSLREIAYERLKAQMGFYVNSEGIVLEHSTGYQAFGVELLGTALRYRTLMEESAPPEWVRKYEAAKVAYALMRRPDDSVPAVGDTDGGPDPFIPLVTTVDATGRAARLKSPPRPDGNPQGRLFPTAGYAIWWNGGEEKRDSTGLRQTFTAWSYFAGHGHKHADELSVLLWGDGQSWWTNVGYWNYGVPGREDAESWPGSDAPHLVHEALHSDRESRLVGAGEAQGISVLDLERRGPASYTARRQIVHLQPDVWLIVDQTTGSAGDSTTTTWTTDPDVTLTSRNAPDTYVLSAERTRSELRAAVRSSEGTRVRVIQESLSPFAGWAVQRGVARPAASVVVDQPARGSWSVMVWRLAPRSDASGVPPSSAGRGTDGDDRPSVRYQSPDSWEVALSPWLGGATVHREGNRVSVELNRTQSARDAVTLTSVPADTTELRAIASALNQTALAYPKFRDYIPARIRITYGILAAFLMQELMLLVLGRRWKGAEVPLRRLAMAGWVVGGLWLMTVYFAH
jgi:hypothetical protein